MSVRLCTGRIVPRWRVEGDEMISLGLILLIVGFILKISILWSIGIALVVIGLILNLVPIGGSTRRVW